MCIVLCSCVIHSSLLPYSNTHSLHSVFIVRDMHRLCRSCISPHCTCVPATIAQETNEPYFLDLDNKWSFKPTKLNTKQTYVMVVCPFV